MPLEDLFVGDLETFLRNHVVSVYGAMAHPTVQNTSVGDEIRAQSAVDFSKKGTSTQLKKTAVSLHAPLFTVTFEQTEDALNSNYIDFSRPRVLIKLDAHSTASTVPVYLVPYEGGTARGVKLPAHGSDNFSTAYAMTATQNGCTFEVSGDPSAPYASHTNVIDVKRGNTEEQWVARQQKINARLNKLQQRFAQAEADASQDSDAVEQRRTQFAYYNPDSQDNTPGHHVNYSAQLNNFGAKTNGVLTKSGPRESFFWGHYRYYCIPTPESMEDITNPRTPSNALVIGRRDQHGWKFFYQITYSIAFHVCKVKKVKGFKLNSGEFMTRNDGNRKRFDANVVVDYGQLWPNPSSHLNDFGPP